MGWRPPWSTGAAFLSRLRQRKAGGHSMKSSDVGIVTVVPVSEPARNLSGRQQTVLGRLAQHVLVG
ncbi:MAG TPA: hypothetical protein DDY22_06860 [Geobacter sp.]|nr:hypothetical protein [Geobacter sp.]